MKNYKSIICVAAAVCLLGTAAFCGFRIYHHYAQVDEQTEAFEEIAKIVEQAPTEETMPDDFQRNFSKFFQYFFQFQ